MASGSAIQRSSGFSNLDPTSAIHVFSYLKARDLCASALVCREWQSLTSEDCLWRDQLEQNPHPLLHPKQSLLLCSEYGCPPYREATPKQAYETSESWRRGRAVASRFESPGSDKAPALKIASGGNHLVVASGGRGTCHVFDLATGVRVPNLGVNASQEIEAMDGIFNCAAISGDCKSVAFGGDDGFARVYDVTSGNLRALLGDPSLSAAVQVLTLSWEGSLLAAGLSDGHVALRKLTETVKLNSDSVTRNSVGNCEVEESSPFSFWDLTVGNQASVTCIETCVTGWEWRNGGEREETKGPVQFVAGTSGGHVMVLDGETGAQKVGLVGSCSCPVACLCVHGGGGGGGRGEETAESLLEENPCKGLLYGSYEHGIVGHGHHNSVYVWDIASATRVALLYPGGKTLRYTGRGGRSGGGLGGAYWGLPVKSVFADGYKVALTAGKSVTVFETRTWDVLYEFRLTHSEDEIVNQKDTFLTNSGGEGGECKSNGGWRQTKGGEREAVFFSEFNYSRPRGSRDFVEEACGNREVERETSSSALSVGEIVKGEKGGMSTLSSGEREDSSNILRRGKKHVRSLSNGGHIVDEPAPLGIHFLENKMALTLVGGAIGVLKFENGAIGIGSAEAQFNRPPN